MTSLKNKKVITKKPHRCNGCLSVFPAKTPMNYWVWSIDGDFNTGYYCEVCEEIWKVESKNNLKDYFEYGFVTEYTSKDFTKEMYLDKLKKEYSNDGLRVCK